MHQPLQVMPVNWKTQTVRIGLGISISGNHYRQIFLGQKVKKESGLSCLASDVAG